MGSIVTGAIGMQQSQKEIDAANAARQQALAQFNGISTPGIADQQINLQDMQNAGDFQAQLQNLIHQDPNALSGITTDPRLAQAQMSALQQLSDIGQMGMTPGEAAALRQANMNAQAQAQAKNSQIMQNMAERGLGGSGMELASRLSAAQGATNQASQNAANLMQQAQARALQAISTQGNMAQSQQGQQFGQQAQVAAAQNAINNFNAQNAQNVQAQNVGMANQASLRNLGNQQQIGNQNVAQHNQQQQYNKQLQQQQFNNQMALAAGKAGQYSGIAQADQQQAGRTGDMWAGIGEGIDTAALGAMKAFGGKSAAPAQPTAQSRGLPANHAQYVQDVEDAEELG